MPITLYQFLHVACFFLFVAMTQRALAAPAARAPGPVKITLGVGILGLIAGFGLLSKMGYGFPGWVIVKILCWLAISAMPFLVLKNPTRAKQLTLTTIAVVLVAIGMVYYRPF